MNVHADVIILNVPEYAHHYPFWVVTPRKGELWFWGAWNTWEECQKYDIDQIIVQNKDVKGKSDER